MWYRIVYRSDNTSRKSRIISNKSKAVFRGTLFAIALLAISLWGEMISRWVVPGDPQITARAFGRLAESLRTEESVEAAIVAFCQEIIDHADLQ